MKGNLRLRILVITAFLGAAGLLYFAWTRMQDNLSDLVTSVEKASQPDKNLVAIKELWTSFRSVANNVRAYTVTRDNRYLEEFLDVKDDIRVTIDSLKSELDREGSETAAFDSLQDLFTLKVGIYEDLLEINYNRVLSQAISKLKTTEPQFDSTSFTDDEGNLVQRIFSSRYSRKSLAARADSLLKERNRRLVEYNRNVRRIQEEEERLLKLQSDRELALLEADIAVTGSIEKLITKLELEEKFRMAARIEMSNTQAQHSARLIRDMVLGGVVIILLLFILVLIDLELSDRRRKQLLEARRKAEVLARAREDFIATVSHEIRTPLTSVIGYAHNLSKTPLTPEQEHFLRAISGSSGHLLAIVNDVLDFTRIESGKLNFDEVSFRPEEVFSDVYRALKWKADEKGLGFNLYMQPIREMVFFGDPVRLRQVLFNLCGNAIKFTAKGKVDITATATRSDNGVVLLFKISDTGIGIPSDKLKTIFEQYEQAARSTERFYGGTGLGLSISKKIVEQLNGNINVESEEHSGSTFSVRIPYSWGNEAEVETSYTEDPSTKPLKGITVIIAEDEPLIRELNVKFLRDNGARVYEAENGKDAIDLLQRYPADLMVMDVQMPVMTGPEAVRQIRSSFSGAKQKVPVIGMTANVLQQDLLSYIDAGMNDTITKPFTGRDLFDKITRLLELPSLITASPDGGRVSETDISEADTERTSEIKSGKMGEERGYNLKSLIDSAAGNNDFIRKMINMFLTSSYASVNNLRFHLNRQNLDQLEKTAHRMIGSAKQMGATQIATLLKDLELAARDTAPREELEHRVKEIEIRMKKMSEMLKEEVRRFED